MNTEPSRGGYRCVTTTFQTSSNEAWMIFAPNLLIASSFVSGALSGTITVQGILFWRACQARAWAMFPALQVYTPRFLAFGPARATALLAPRTLKEPVGCKFSSFRKISADASSMFKRTSGVRTTFPLIRSLASSISFSGIGRRSSELGTSFSSITDLQADAGSQLLNTNGAGRQYGSYEKGSCENWSRASWSSIFARCQVRRIVVCFGAGTDRQNRESNSWRHQSADKGYSGEFQEDRGGRRVQYGLRPPDYGLRQGSSRIFCDERDLLQFLQRPKAGEDDCPGGRSALRDESGDPGHCLCP